MAAAADTRTVTIRLSELTEHLGCVLCRGLLREAQTIPECLHSFCKSCIYRHFIVQGSRKCPKCFVTLKPRPITTLISDQKLQDVVDRVFPEHKENDERLETEFYERHAFVKKDKSAEDATYVRPFARSSSGDSASRSRKKSMQMPLNLSGPRPVASFLIEVHPQSEYVQASRTATVMRNGASRPPTIRIDMEPLPKLTKPYLLADGRYKIFDLLKWIRRQLELSDTAELEVTCMGATVGPELSIQFIHRTIWQQQHEDKERLQLHYRLLIP